MADTGKDHVWDWYSTIPQLMLFGIDASCPVSSLPASCLQACIADKVGSVYYFDIQSCDMKNRFC